MRAPKFILATVVAASFAAPVSAGSMYTSDSALKTVAETANPIIKVQRLTHPRRKWNQHYRNHRDGDGYYRGYRGRRDPRPGWRYHEGWWFPPAAFALGAIIGGAFMSNPNNLPREHYRWCDLHYQTYRFSDNTYIPRVGERAVCRSPYWP